MVKRYSDEIRNRARELWESGADVKNIVQELKLSRENTIYDWVKKFGWKRLSDLDARKDELKIFEILAQRAKDFLLDQKFTSITEALRVYEKALIKIRLYKKKGTKKKSKEKLKDLFEDDSFNFDQPETYDD